MTDRPQEPADRAEPLSEATPRDIEPNFTAQMELNPVGTMAELTTTRQQLTAAVKISNELMSYKDELARELAATRQERGALETFIQERRTHYAKMQGANKGHLFDWFMGKKDFADELLAEIERLKGDVK